METASHLGVCSVHLRIGRNVSYDEALCWQEEAVALLKRDAEAAERIFFIEHTPVITMGRSSDPRHLLRSAADLEASGIALRAARRGGSFTYHGPGQWTIYPILRLAARGRDLHRYLRQLEEVAIRFLARRGLSGIRVPGRSGVWVEERGRLAKIAAVGIAVTNWISYHGLAVNIAPDLEIFRRAIIPCGIPPEEGDVTSLAALGCHCDMETAAAELTADFEEIFQVRCNHVRRFPPWLRKRLPTGGQAREVREHLHALRLDTVCRQARCPNQSECFAKGRATFLLLGPWCTRNCRFCSVERCGAHQHLPQPDADEPRRVAEAIARLRLRHAVITSVTRDDLADGGASHFVAAVAAVRQTCPQTTIEILVPDFCGNLPAWSAVVDCRPDVFNHNVETVPRLYPQVRPQADYRRSLALLAFAKRRQPQMLTKSGLMVGLGESVDEILAVGRDLRAAGVDMLTLGQYLQPTPHNLPVARFVPPAEMEALAQILRHQGFSFVAAAPFVRSSYNAAEALTAAREPKAQIV